MKVIIKIVGSKTNELHTKSALLTLQTWYSKILLKSLKFYPPKEATRSCTCKTSVDRKLLSVNARMRVWGDVLGTGSSDRLP
jgi:hypothetical protein